MTEVIIVIGMVGLVAAAFVVTYVISFVRAVRRGYDGPQVFSTWTLVKMALAELVGRGE